MNLKQVARPGSRVSWIAGILAIGLAGCGGGGSARSAAPAGPVASTDSFALRAALANYYGSPSNTSYTVSGSCTGSASIADAAPSTSVFGTTAALAVAPCPSFASSTRTLYFDSFYDQLGVSIVGGLYGVAPQAVTYPAKAVVGDKGTVGSLVLFTDSSQTLADGQLVEHYSLTADTAATAIVTITKYQYSPAGKLIETIADSYRISLSAGLVPLSETIQQYSPTGDATAQISLTPN